MVIVAIAVAVLVGACGGDSGGSGGPVTLSWFIFNEPSGAPQKIAEKCSKESGGAYKIDFEYLPSQADQQREQLVRRLGAEDSSIDLIGMDVVWTGEFANAGWIKPVPADVRAAVTKDVFPSVLATAQFEKRLYNVPIWSNTQLLWYRSDRAPNAPSTWDQMIDEAEKIGPDKGRIQVQGSRYEGLTVWTNQMIESAGTTILSSPTTVNLARPQTERALSVMGRLSRSPVAAPNIATSTEDTARLGFEGGDSTFMINYPFVYPSAKDNAPDVFKVMKAARYPRVDAGRVSRPPIGGINLGVSSYSKHADVAFQAVQCLIRPENQIEVAKLGGLPPVREDLYSEKAVKDIYPGFADLIAESIKDGGPRPSQSPAYQDLSLAIQRAMSPTTDIDPKDPGPAYDRLKDNVDKAVKREGLL